MNKAESIIRTLYEHYAYSELIPEGEEYEQLDREKIAASQALWKTLSPAQEELFDRYTEAEVEVETHLISEAYRKGFQHFADLFLEAIKNEKQG